MRISSLLVVACAAALLSTGCMTDDSMGRDSYAHVKRSTFEDNIDFRKVNIIEAQAARSGNSIVWVHLPVKKYRQSRSERVGIN